MNKDNTIKEIKAFLDQHKIEYPSTAKKDQLLKLAQGISEKEEKIAKEVQQTADNFVESLKDNDASKMEAPAPVASNPALQTNTPKEFFMKVLNGSAQGILIGVLPAAVMANILKYTGLIHTGLGSDLSAIYTLYQSMIPFLIGMAIALQFKLKPIDVGTTALATGVASGSIKWALASGKDINPITHLPFAKGTNAFIAAGAGDVINAMLIAAVAVLVIKLVAKYLNGFGALSIIFSPVFIGGFVGAFGLAIAPYVGKITGEIGDVISKFTDLAPYPMSILIAMAFAILIITPISTVGIALAITLAGLGSGAAGVGVVATTVVLVINSLRANKIGVTLAIIIGAVKGMMPSVFKKPVTILAFMATAAISAIPVAMFNVQGTPQSAGFGYIGLVSPLKSIDMDTVDKSILLLNKINPNLINFAEFAIVWFVVPILAGLLVNYVFTKILKLYSAADFKQDM
jgi:uncharacterized membrane protein